MHDFRGEMQRYLNDEIEVIQRLNLDDINEAMNAIAEAFAGCAME